MHNASKAFQFGELFRGQLFLRIRSPKRSMTCMKYNFRTSTFAINRFGCVRTNGATFMPIALLPGIGLLHIIFKLAFTYHYRPTPYPDEIWDKWLTEYAWSQCDENSIVCGDSMIRTESAFHYFIFHRVLTPDRRRKCKFLSVSYTSKFAVNL